MDPLSITLSITALLKLTKDVVSYIKEVKEASDERKRFIRETASLSGMLNTLVDFVNEEDPSDPWLHAVHDLIARDGPFDQFSVALQSLKVELTPTSGILKVRRALMWKYIKDDVQSLLSRIERLKSLVGVALEVDHIRLSKEIKSALANVTSGMAELQISTKAIQENTSIILDETHVRQKKELLDKICSVDYMQQHRDAISRHHHGTGQWFLTDPVYQKWDQSSSGTLACPGAPGAGKTIMAALVIERQLRTLHSPNNPVVFIYYNYKRQDQQTLKHTMESMIRQIIDVLPRIPESAQTLYNNRNTPSNEEAKEVLKGLLVHVKVLTVITDALDECKDYVRHDVLSLFVELQALVNFRHVATTRDMRVETSHVAFNDQPVLVIRAIRRDLEDYTRSRAKLLRAKLEPDLLEELVVGAVTAAEGMFLMAQLLMDSFQVKLKVRSIRFDLHTLPKGVDAYDIAYEDAMTRIFGQEADCQEVAQKTMSLVLSARRPLKTSELQHALMVETGDTKLDEENRLEAEIILSVCAGLITIDESSQTIGFVHYTTQEYLHRTQERWLPGANLHIARACLDYLLLREFSSSPLDGSADSARGCKRFDKYFFTNYAIMNGPFHWDTLVRAEPSLESGLVTLFVKSQALIVIQNVLRKWEPTIIHWVLGFGLIDLGEFCIANGCEPDQEDSHKRTPLSYAAAAGKESVVRLLLTHNASVTSESMFDRWTPLTHAIAANCEPIVRMLLEHHAFVDPRDHYQGTPLMYVVEKGTEAMVRLLLEHGAETNAKDDSGWTPLIYAASGGHDQITRLILEQDVAIDAVDRFGRTALSHAVISGHESVVRALLQAGATIDCLETSGKTPLSHAARMGRESISQILLDHNASLNHEDNQGVSPLSSAFKYGNERVVHLLLNHGAGVHSASDPAQTPSKLLSWAAEIGNLDIVRLLLDRRTDPNIPDEKGRTPLHLAVMARKRDVVSILCNDPRVKTDELDSRGRTPLSYALVQKHGWQPRSKAKCDSGNTAPRKNHCGYWSPPLSDFESDPDLDSVTQICDLEECPESGIKCISHDVALSQSQTQCGPHSEAEWDSGLALVLWTGSEPEEGEKTGPEAEEEIKDERSMDIEIILDLLLNICHVDALTSKYVPIGEGERDTEAVRQNDIIVATHAELPLDRLQGPPPMLDQSPVSPSTSILTDQVPDGPETKDHCSLLATFPQ